MNYDQSERSLFSIFIYNIKKNLILLNIGETKYPLPHTLPPPNMGGEDRSPTKTRMQVAKFRSIVICNPVFQTSNLGFSRFDGLTGNWFPCWL